MIKIINKIINTEINTELENINIFLADKTSLPEYIENSMENYRGFPAIKDEHNQIEMTYDEVLDNIKWIASAMQATGIQKGDFVTFLSENNGKHFIFNQGLMKAGAASVLRGTETEESELKYILEHSESKAVILSDYQLLNRFQDYFNKSSFIKFIVVIFDKGEKANNLNLPVYSFEEFINIGKKHDFVNPNLTIYDNAEMLYTSGTTGFPKGVLLTHRNLLSQCPTVSEGLGIKRGEKSLQILPIWHSYESTTQSIFFATGFYLHFTTLANLKNDLKKYDIDVFMSVPRIWEAIRLGIYQKLKQKSKLNYYLFDFAVKNSIKYKIHKMYSEQRITNKQTSYKKLSMLYHTAARALIKPLHVYFTNTIYKNMKNAVGLNFRASFSGGGALSLKDELFYDAIGVNIRTGYGLTETSPDLTLRHANDKNYLCSVGKPIKGTEIKIVNPETLEELGIFQQGLVFVRGPQVMKGYYKDEEATKKIIDSEGWFNTGDLGWLTSDNHLVLVGRLKETIILSNGENVEPIPIEEACLESKFIEQIVLVGQDKNSIGALVIPTQEALEKCGLVLNDLRKGTTLSIKNPNLQELIKKEIDSYIKNKPNLKSFEKIKKIEILKDSFNQENGLLSKTGKTKRNSVFNEYHEIIAKMFSDK